MHESKGLTPSVRKAGAQGYVVKSRAARDLIEALERLLAGGTFFDASSPSGAKEVTKNLTATFFSAKLSALPVTPSRINHSSEAH